MPDEMNQQQYQQTPLEQVPQQVQQPPIQQPGVVVQQPVQAKGTSGMGIASLVLGILAILTSFLPIINNGSFFLALLGIILAIVGIIATKKGKKSGRGLAIAGLILNILSVVIVLATQSLYSAAIDSAVDELETGSKPVATTPTTAESKQAAETSDSANDTTTSAESDEQAEANYSNMPLGQSVEFKDGLQVSVDAVIPGLTNYNDEPITGITVTYVNNGSKNLSFNPYDWKAEDVNGILDSQAFYMDGENELNSGELTPGSTITGNIYFEGELARAYYYDNGLFQSESSISWALQ